MQIDIQYENNNIVPICRAAKVWDYFPLNLSRFVMCIYFPINIVINLLILVCFEHVWWLLGVGLNKLLTYVCINMVCYYRDFKWICFKATSTSLKKILSRSVGLIFMHNLEYMRKLSNSILVYLIVISLIVHQNSLHFISSCLWILLYEQSKLLEF